LQIEDHTEIKNRGGIVFVNGYDLGRYWNKKYLSFETVPLKTTYQPVSKDLRLYQLNSILYIALNIII